MLWSKKLIMVGGIIRQALQYYKLRHRHLLCCIKSLLHSCNTPLLHSCNTSLFHCHNNVLASDGELQLHLTNTATQCCPTCLFLTGHTLALLQLLTGLHYSHALILPANIMKPVTIYGNLCSVHKHARGLVVVLPAHVSARAGAKFSTALLPTSLNCRLQSTQ